MQSVKVTLLTMIVAACALPASAQQLPDETSPTTQPSEMSGDQRNYVDRMSAEHADDAPTPSGAAQVAPAAEVQGEEVVYATLDYGEVTGYLARPAGVEAPLPAVVVIHEWWGLNDNIRAMADQLAGQGYLALAVDLYRGEAASAPESARALMQSTMEREGELGENLRQAIAYLQETGGGGKIGVIGWCFGGGWSLRAALLAPETISATVIYYGHVGSDPETLAPLESPILGIFGAEDEGIPVESVRAFESTLNELGKAAEIHVYEGASHAFANPSGHHYEPVAAEDAWTRTLAFLDQYLSP